MNDLCDVIAKKCNIIEEKTLRKAKELLNRLGNHKELSSEYCKVAVCLELASNLSLSTRLSRENAIKVSGCKKSVYVNQFNVISKLLNLDQVYTVKELSLTLCVPELENTAKRLLEKHLSDGITADIDLQHPMFACSALLAAAKINKVKINQAKLIELSRIKKKEMLALTVVFQNYADALSNPKKRKSYVNLKFINVEEECFEKKKIKKTAMKTEEDDDIDYLNWKKRMLSEF